MIRITITCKGLQKQILLAKENGQNQIAIARIAQIHATRLSSIINERKEPSKSEMIKLCKVFNKKIEELFEYEITNPNEVK